MLFYVLVFSVDIATVYFVFPSLMCDLTPLRMLDLGAGSLYISGSSLNIDIVDIAQQFHGFEEYCASRICINITDHFPKARFKRMESNESPCLRPLFILNSPESISAGFNWPRILVALFSQDTNSHISGQFYSAYVIQSSLEVFPSLAQRKDLICC